MKRGRFSKSRHRLYAFSAEALTRKVDRALGWLEEAWDFAARKAITPPAVARATPDLERRLRP
jgi:hypothetical protein